MSAHFCLFFGKSVWSILKIVPDLSRGLSQTSTIIEYFLKMALFLPKEPTIWLPISYLKLLFSLRGVCGSGELDYDRDV